MTARRSRTVRQRHGSVVRLKNASGLEAEHGMGPDRNTGDAHPRLVDPRRQGNRVSADLGTSGGSKLELLSLADAKRDSRPWSPTATSARARSRPTANGWPMPPTSPATGRCTSRPFPATGGKLQVSRGGGLEPRWRRRRQGDLLRQLCGIEQAAHGGAGQCGGRALHRHVRLRCFRYAAARVVSSTDLFSYDVTADGQRFLVNQYVKPAQVQPLNIVLNATADSH